MPCIIPCSTALTSIPVRCRICPVSLLPPSLSGFLFQESKSFHCFGLCQFWTMRECRGEISGKQSGNKSSSHVLSSGNQQSVNLPHGFIVNRSDVAFRLTFRSVCSIFDNALGFILVIDKLQQNPKARRAHRIMVLCRNIRLGCDCHGPVISLPREFEWFAAAFIHPFGNADRMIAVFAVNPART